MNSARLLRAPAKEPCKQQAASLETGRVGQCCSFSQSRLVTAEGEESEIAQEFFGAVASLS